MKKVLIKITTVLLGISLMIVCGCEKEQKKEEIKKDEIKVNKNEDVIKDQIVDEIEIKNTSLVTINGISKLTTTVTNNTEKDYKLEEYTIIIKDEKGEVIIKLPGYVGDTIKKGETRTINSSVAMDLSNAKSIEYEVKK